MDGHATAFQRAVAFRRLKLFAVEWLAPGLSAACHQEKGPARMANPIVADSERARLRAEFPALDQEVPGKRLVYLDSAASTQKPISVIETIRRFYGQSYANVHRGFYPLSENATALYERGERI